MDSKAAYDWLELAQDGDLDRALDRLIAVGPTVAMRDLRLHLQLQMLALAPIGVLAPAVPHPRMAIDWAAIERRWMALTAAEHTVLEAAAAEALRHLRQKGAVRHSRIDTALGAEAEDLRVHLQLQELALQESLEQAAPAAAAEAPRLTIDWTAIANRSARLSARDQQDLREAAMQSMTELKRPVAAAVEPLRLPARVPPRWLPWAAAAAALVVAGLGLYEWIANPGRSPAPAHERSIAAVDTAATRVQPPASRPAIAPVNPTATLPIPAEAAAPTPPGDRIAPAAKPVELTAAVPGTASAPTGSSVSAEAGTWLLPFGTRATVADQGRVQVESTAGMGDRLTQVAGKVSYALGVTPVELRLPADRGTVRGANADLSIDLGAGSETLTAIAVTRGSVMLIDSRQQQHFVVAGQTGYLAPSGAVLVQASQAAAPAFPLPQPGPAPVEPFHPTDMTPTAAIPQTLPRPTVSAGAVSTGPAGSATQAATAGALPDANHPPEDLPPGDFTSHGTGGLHVDFALPTNPTPNGSSQGQGKAGGKGKADASGKDGGDGWANGAGGLHLGQGAGNGNGAGSAGPGSGSPGGDAGAHGKGHGK